MLNTMPKELKKISFAIIEHINGYTIYNSLSQVTKVFLNVKDILKEIELCLQPLPKKSKNNNKQRKEI